VRYNSRSDRGNLSDVPPDIFRSIEIISGDVRDQLGMTRLLKGAETVFHLAALIGIPYSYESPKSYTETNVEGTLHILEAARENGSRVLLTSTSEVYGTAVRTPMSEDHPLQAQSPYSATKIAADMLGQAFALSFGLPVAIVRPFNTFGPRQSMRAFIPTVMVQALRGDTVRLGDLTPIRDLNFVSNTVDGFLAVARLGVFDARIYNLASGEGRSIEEVARKILQMTRPDGNIILEPCRVRPDNSEVRLLIGDSSRAKGELGWAPRVSFDEGIQLSLNWIRENPGRFQAPADYSR